MSSWYGTIPPTTRICIWSNIGEDELVCGQPYDVHYRNKEPIWVATSPRWLRPQPHLGHRRYQRTGTREHPHPHPRTRNLSHLRALLWRFLRVRHTAYRDTVRVFLNGLQVGEYRRTLETEKALWAVADVTGSPMEPARSHPTPATHRVKWGRWPICSHATQRGFSSPDRRLRKSS